MQNKKLNDLFYIKDIPIKGKTFIYIMSRNDSFSSSSAKPKSPQKSSQESQHESQISETENDCSCSTCNPKDVNESNTVKSNNTTNDLSKNPTVPRVGIFMLMVSVMFSMFEIASEHYGNALIGVCAIGALYMIKRTPWIANPTPEMKSRIWIGLLMYISAMAFWGYVPYHQCLTASNHVATCVHQNLWRFILWPGAVLSVLATRLYENGGENTLNWINNLLRISKK